MLSPPWSSSSPTPNAMPPSIPTLNPISLAFTTHRHSHHCHYHGYDYTDIHGHHYPHHHHHASSASSANVPRKSEHEHGGHSISSFSPVTYFVLLELRTASCLTANHKMVYKLDYEIIWVCCPFARVPNSWRFGKI